MTEQPGNETTEDVSEAFDLLRSARRRGVLYVLSRNGQMTVRTVARRIAAWQSDGSEDGPDVTTVETSLVHSHLPRLDDAGVVEYDPDEATVELDESARDLEPLLRRTSECEPGFPTAVSRRPSDA